jgi:hypothetical protein
MKLLVCPTTQIGAATANRMVRSFTRDIDRGIVVPRSAGLLARGWGRIRVSPRADTWVGPYLSNRTPVVGADPCVRPGRHMGRPYLSGIAPMASR